MIIIIFILTEYFNYDKTLKSKKGFEHEKINYLK